MNGFEAITFDVGGTLIEPWPSVGHVYATVAEEHGIHGLSPNALNDRFVRAWKALDGRVESMQDWQAIVAATFHGRVSEPDSRVLFDSLYARFVEPSVWHIYDDVRPTLEVLRSRGVRLAILSNWDERLRPLLKQLGLSHYFEAAIVSSEVGSRKPEPAIFQQAAKALGLPPGHVLHVGDSLEQDVRGAHAAGFQALRIQRGDNSGDDLWIRSLTDLLQMA